jgi:tRNA modification GTPase
MGKSGVAVIRISGDRAFDVFSQMTDLDVQKITPRKMYFTTLFKNVSRETLDKVLISGYKSPNSFTGEDIVEINCHGSKAVIKSVLNALSSLNNFRIAEPGEFSRRAFYNGKMDLTEAEGLADLIDAETELQQSVALRQMSGTLFNLYKNWRSRLVETLSFVEAYIDFPDEDIPQNTVFKLQNNVFKVSQEIREHLATNNVEERLRDGFNVVISGPTNAGKSSLINTIAKRNVAIVSDIDGTTRDSIDCYIDLKGYPIIFSDTAGLRPASDEIEKIGIDIALRKIENADFNIFLFDSEEDSPEVFSRFMGSKNNYLIVGNKAENLTLAQREVLEKQNVLLISAKQNQNIDVLLDKICAYLSEQYSLANANLITRQRYRENLEECLANLDRFDLEKEIELAAEDIRLACRAIGKITGQVEVSEILDKIFSTFCIGK